MSPLDFQIFHVPLVDSFFLTDPPDSESKFICLSFHLLGIRYYLEFFVTRLDVNASVYVDFLNLN